MIRVQYHVTVVGHDEGVAVHAELVRQREPANVVDQHVRAGDAEQIRRTLFVITIILAIEHGRAHRGQQSVFMPEGGGQNGRVLLDVFVLVQLWRNDRENGESQSIMAARAIICAISVKGGEDTSIR